MGVRRKDQDAGEDRADARSPRRAEHDAEHERRCPAKRLARVLEAAGVEGSLREACRGQAREDEPHRDHHDSAHSLQPDFIAFEPASGESGQDAEADEDEAEAEHIEKAAPDHASLKRGRVGVDLRQAGSAQIADVGRQQGHHAGGEEGERAGGKRDQEIGRHSQLPKVNVYSRKPAWSGLIRRTWAPKSLRETTG